MLMPVMRELVLDNTLCLIFVYMASNLM